MGLSCSPRHCRLLCVGSVPAPGPFRAEMTTLPFDGSCGWARERLESTSHLSASGTGPSSVLAAWSRKVNSETGQLLRAPHNATMDACGLRRASSQRCGMALKAHQGHFTCQSTPESLGHHSFPTITSIERPGFGPTSAPSGLPVQRDRAPFYHILSPLLAKAKGGSPSTRIRSLFD